LHIQGAADVSHSPSACSCGNVGTEYHARDCRFYQFLGRHCQGSQTSRTLSAAQLHRCRTKDPDNHCIDRSPLYRAVLPLIVLSFLHYISGNPSLSPYCTATSTCSTRLVIISAEYGFVDLCLFAAN